MEKLQGDAKKKKKEEEEEEETGFRLEIKLKVY